MSHISQTTSRMDLISEEEERGRGRESSEKDGKKKKRHSRSKSAHKCKSRGVKHHSENCRKHSRTSTDDTAQFKAHDSSYYVSSEIVPPTSSTEMARKPSSHVTSTNGVTSRKSADRGVDGQHTRGYTDEERKKDSAASSHNEYIAPKVEEPLFSRSTSASHSSLQVGKRSSSLATRKWCLCVSVAILFLGVFASAGIYFGYSYLNVQDTILEKVYKGKFRIDTDEGWVPDPGSVFHTQKAEQYRSYIHQLLANSALSNQYKSTEVFLLESDPDGILVNFNLHFQQLYNRRLEAQDVSTVLESQIKTSGLLPDLDLTTMDIQEREYTVKRPSTGNREQEKKEKLVIDLIGRRECRPLLEGYCSELPYNITSLPNILGHTHSHQVEKTMQSIRTVVESGCFPLSYELLCQLVQPVCYNQRIVPPCQAFCQEFLTSCESDLPPDILEYLNCNILPTEADGPGACISKPGCVNEMRSSGKKDRVCDGVVDCPDFSDELYCPYCKEKHFHCGVGLNCIPKNKICDGEPDCPNGSDEKGCVSLAPRVSAGSYIHHYHDNGYILFQQKGKAGKVCAESLNGTEPQEAQLILSELGQKVCKGLEYISLEGVAVGRDDEAEDIQYVHIDSVMDNEFNTVECESKSVVRLECKYLECGHRHNEQRNNSNPVIHGDWPWQVALNREGVHVCDGTLIHEQWVMSTASCFQGQNKANWQAVVGTVRLKSRAPWEQSQRIVGMVKSGVEGNDIVLLKLEKKIVFSDFARPICLPETDDWTNSVDSECYSLGWDNKEDMLRPIKLTRTELAKCEDKSEVSVNSICTRSTEDSCDSNVSAGAGLMCRDQGMWYLVGVSSWRNVCDNVNSRPRLYDAVSLTTDWADKVVHKQPETQGYPASLPPVLPQVPRRRIG